MSTINDQYRIVLNMRVPEGFIETGIFYIGNDFDAALSLFSELEGSRNIYAAPILRLDLIGHEEGLDTL